MSYEAITSPDVFVALTPVLWEASRLLASMPAMVEEIERLRELADTADEVAAETSKENIQLRALNAELLSSAEQFLRKLEFLCECAEGSGCKDAARRGALRDLIARAETAL